MWRCWGNRAKHVDYPLKHLCPDQVRGHRGEKPPIQNRYAKFKTQILHGVCAWHVCVCVCVWGFALFFSAVSYINPLSLDCSAIYHSSPERFHQRARRINKREERWPQTSAAPSRTVHPHSSFPRPWAKNSSWFFTFATGTQYPGQIYVSLPLCMSVYLNMCDINVLYLNTLMLLESRAAFVVIWH